MPAFADAIAAYQDMGGAVSFPMKGLIEEAGQTFLLGTPVQVNATDGGVQAWDGTTLTAGIAGFSTQPGQNMGTTGSGAPTLPYGPISGYGSLVGNFAPPGDSNQPLAVITPPMVPITDGYTYFLIAAPTTLFIGTLGSSSGTPGPVATTNQQVGVAYGLTKDASSNYWYVDTNKTGANAAVRIVGLYPLEPVGTVGGHVIFSVLNAVAQIFD
jgi:hypothetical protein